MRKVRSRPSRVAVVVSLSLFTALLLPGCTEECTTAIDCTGTAGQTFTCQDNQCLAVTPTGGTDAGANLDAGATPDAGNGQDAGATPDAGSAPDAGNTDAGLLATFVATLTGAEQVPPVTTAAQGQATFSLSADRTTLSFTVTHDAVGATAAHLHAAYAGENGGVALPFAAATSPITGQFSLTAGQLEDLEKGKLYVNVHTPAHPGGEIRGQILRPGEKLFVAKLNGLEQVPALSSVTTSGTAAVILNSAADSVRYHVTTDVGTVSASHIHAAVAGSNGPVVVPFTPAGSTMDGTGSVDAAAALALQGGGLYVNVHSPDHPAGEVRGQLLLPGERLFVAHLSTAQEVSEPSASTATAVAQVVLNPAGTSVRYLVTHTVGSPTAAHVHAGHGGISGPVVFPLTVFATGYAGTATVTTAQADALQSGQQYVNIHTAANAPGEIRGQLLRPGETLYTAVLSGANQVPAVVTSASGGASVIVSPAGTSARWDLSWTGISVANTTAAHIHEGAAGINGVVRFPLTVATTPSTGTLTLTPADRVDLDAAGLYVNVHSADHPGGEIRGNLIKR